MLDYVVKRKTGSRMFPLICHTFLKYCLFRMTVSKTPLTDLCSVHRIPLIMFNTFIMFGCTGVSSISTSGKVPLMWEETSLT